MVDITLNSFQQVQPSLVSISLVLDTYHTTFDKGENKVNLYVYDTAASEDWSQIFSLLYPYTHCSILCYGVTQQWSFDRLKTFWLPELEARSETREPILICGNKLDLRSTHANDYIDNEYVEEQMEHFPRVERCMQCSALDVLNNQTQVVSNNTVDEVFNLAIDLALLHIDTLNITKVCCVLL